MRHDIAVAAVSMWNRGVSHPNIIHLKDAFVTNGALFFQHHYLPGSLSLREMYVDRRGTHVLSENILWSIATQIIAAVRVVHRSNMAVRCISINRILYTGHHRYVISGVGVLDVLEYESKKRVTDLQREDMAALGHVLIQTACRSMQASHNMRKSIDFVTTHYSEDLKNFILILLSPSTTTTVNDICTLPFMASHFLDDLDRVYSINISLDTELEKECENGRILRLLFKLNSINDRSHLLSDDTWAETGNRYLLKLFRDYVFHQVNESEAPRLDLGHVLECLNKVDVGSEEQVLLTSADGKSILLLTYNDIKRCLEQSWLELQGASERNTVSLPSYSGGGGNGGRRSQNHNNTLYQTKTLRRY